MKKGKTALAIVVIVLALAAGGIFVYGTRQPEVVAKDDLVFDYKQDVKVSDIIAQVNKGSLVNGDDVISTSVLGEYVIQVETTNLFKTKTYIDNFKVTVADKSAPVIIGAEDAVVARNNLHFMLNNTAYAVDNYDASVEVKFQYTYDITTAGQYPMTFTAVDEAGNKTVVEKTLTVADLCSPTLSGVKNVTIKRNSAFDPMSGVSATDDVDGKVEVKLEGEYDLTVNGTYTLTYTAVDKSGNETKAITKLKVADNTNNPISQNEMELFFTTPYGYQGHVVGGITYVEGYMIANKTYSLPSTYNPGGLLKETTDAYNKMRADCQAAGNPLTIVSGYRSYSYQVALYNMYVEREGKEVADGHSARPGHSEHQAGLAFDVNSVAQSFENTSTFRWLQQNAYKYGFILRYPKGKTNETGYIYEPWHYRYVGVELATKLYNNGDWITVEDYFGLTSKYK